MSVKIRLKRFGSKMRPFYRIVVMDSRMARDSRTIEEIGLYHPIETGDKQLVIDEQKAKGWLSKGAQPSDTVRGLLNRKNIFVKREPIEPRQGSIEPQQGPIEPQQEPIEPQQSEDSL